LDFIWPARALAGNLVEPSSGRHAVALWKIENKIKKGNDKKRLEYTPVYEAGQSGVE